MAVPASPRLSESQLATLGQIGEERTADVGDVLFRVGDQSYPFIAIVEGEVAILDAAGTEVIRHGASGFAGEMNLLSGQTVFLTAVVTRELRYIAVEREALRSLLFEDGPLSDLLLSTFIARREALQGVHGIGFEVIGPRSSEATLRIVEFARSNRLPFTWRDPEQADDDEATAMLVAGLDPADVPLVRLPGGVELRGPSTGELSRGPGGSGVRRVRRVGDPGRGEHSTWWAGGFVSTDRELPRVPSRNQRFGADQPRGRTGAQIRSSNRDAVPCDITRTARRRLPSGLGRGPRDPGAHGAACDRRAVPTTACRRTFGLRGCERVLLGGAARGAALRGIARRRDRRRELGRSGCRLAGSRRRARDPASPPRRSARDDVGLPRARTRPVWRRGA